MQYLVTEAMLGELTAVDVLQGLIDYLHGPKRRKFNDPRNWVYQTAGRKIGAWPLVAYAAFHSELGLPVGHLSFDGSTDVICRQRLETLGFRFKADAKRIPN